MITMPAEKTEHQSKLFSFPVDGHFSERAWVTRKAPKIQRNSPHEKS